MKSKRILLVYVKGFIDNLASTERAFNEVINELVSEGRVIHSSTQTTTKFEDGTTVTRIPFGKGMAGARITHLYLDEKLFELQSGEKYVKEALFPLVVQEGSYVNFDAQGKPMERIKVFSKNGTKPIDNSNK
jgi:hypothetical protein